MSGIARLTIALPEKLYRDIKLHVAAEETSIRELVERLFEKELKEKGRPIVVRKKHGENNG
jgi:hypothetical protein